jgi:hypothetical protein
MMPAIVDSSGTVGHASALPGSPPICGIAGDQQASLVGQGCTLPGLAKATFGTGGMLDQCVGPAAPGALGRGDSGTFPIVTFRVDGQTTWGTEAVMLSAGTCIEWLRDDLGIIATSKESETVAAQCATAGDVWFVPALLGLGTPVWDFGARGTLVGLTRGSGRPEIVRAVLEGVAHRGADLVEASEQDSGFPDCRAPHRRRYDGQHRVRPGPGRRHRAPRRDLTGTGGDHIGGRPPRRIGRRQLRSPRPSWLRPSHLASRWSPQATSPIGWLRGTGGWQPASSPKAPFPISRASPSEGASTRPRRRSRRPSDPLPCDLLIGKVRLGRQIR